MGRIRALDDGLINRIAAGEVVERPASVVKELVENSLDAGATRIEIAIEGGGRRLIRVSDDGCGMDRDDVLLAVERHATSKLAGPADLEAISSLGFRGEALASIAAVSQFRLSSAVEDGAGTEVRVRGGRVEAVTDVGLPRGTSVEVGRLFFNMPARRKFLRAEPTETSHIVRTVTRHALAHPAVRFQLAQGQRPLLRAAAASGRLQRIGDIYGSELAARLIPFSAEVAGVRIEGLAGRPVDSLPRGDGQHLFVNGRAVQDRMLAHAVRQAYGNTAPSGRFPMVFLFVDLDPARVDVNVHPQKAEVRFREPGRVHDLVREAVSSALSAVGVIAGYGDLRPEGPRADRTGVAEATARYLETHGESGERPAHPRGPTAAFGETAAGPAPIFVDRATGEVVPAPPVPAARVPGTPRLEQEEHRAVPLAQFQDSYIVAQDTEGLIIVDQHAAHERVLFERFLEQARENRVETQRLLFPATLELAPHELLLLEQELEEFRRLGFLVEPFGGNTVRVDGVPALAAEVEPEALLRELLGEAGQTRAAASGVDSLRHRLVTSAACQAAIKIHHPLTAAGMQGLLDDLYRTNSPSTCPHGRPVLFRLTLSELERTFRRR